MKISKLKFDLIYDSAIVVMEMLSDVPEKPEKLKVPGFLKKTSAFSFYPIINSPVFGR